MSSTNRWQKSHRSVKIPHVKLRPPQARAVSEAEIADAEDDAHFRRTRNRGVSSGAHTPADFYGHARTPLRGTVLSFTGIEDKRELVDIAERLGACVHADLTSEVTHLVARTPGSEKYRIAIQFHMCIVQPEWLYLVREAWLSGEDAVDLAGVRVNPCGVRPLTHTLHSSLSNANYRHWKDSRSP
jgi:hypothetical protein